MRFLFYVEGARATGGERPPGGHGDRSQTASFDGGDVDQGEQEYTEWMEKNERMKKKMKWAFKLLKQEQINRAS